MAALVIDLKQPVYTFKNYSYAFQTKKSKIVDWHLVCNKLKEHMHVMFEIACLWLSHWTMVCPTNYTPEGNKDALLHIEVLQQWAMANKWQKNEPNAVSY